MFEGIDDVDVEAVTAAFGTVEVMARGRAVGAACPDCGRFSDRVHDRYQRRLKDLPLSEQGFVIRLTVRRFTCGVADCPRRRFAEPFSRLAAPHARFTMRLNRALERMGLALAGRAGARLAARLGFGRGQLHQRRHELLRLVHGGVRPGRLHGQGGPGGRGHRDSHQPDRGRRAERADRAHGYPRLVSASQCVTADFDTLNCLADYVRDKQKAKVEELRKAGYKAAFADPIPAFRGTRDLRRRRVDHPPRGGAERGRRLPRRGSGQPGTLPVLARGERLCQPGVVPPEERRYNGLCSRHGPSTGRHGVQGQLVAADETGSAVVARRANRLATAGCLTILIALITVLGVLASWLWYRHWHDGKTQQ